MLKLKFSVNTLGVKPEILLAMFIVYTVYEQNSEDCTITSITDSGHGDYSRHYLGMAFDVRTKSIRSLNKKKRIIRQIEEALPNKEFKILFEDEGGEHEHIHISYKIKQP